MKRLLSIKSTWFYSKPHPLLRLLTIYVKGDMLILLPFIVFIGFIGLYSLRFMCLVYALFYTVRGCGEMIYWFSHQFWTKKYRPDDFGFKNLNNDAIYILYQIVSIVTTILGLSFVLYILLYIY